jgi:hypothetical protein
MTRFRRLHGPSAQMTSMLDPMGTQPGGEILSALFVCLILGVLAVVLVPQLRQRRWLVWTVVGGFVVLMVVSLVWTYTL